MPFYTFETIPLCASDPVRRHELWELMKNPPLKRQHETGESLRRVFPAARDALEKRPRFARERAGSL